MLKTIYTAANIRSMALCLGCVFYPSMAISGASADFISFFERVCIKHDVPTSITESLPPGIGERSQRGDGSGGRDYGFRSQASNAKWTVIVNISKSGEVTGCSASGMMPSDTIGQEIGALPGVINDRLPPYIVKPEGNIWLLQPNKRIGFIYLIELKGGFIVGLDYMPTSIFTNF